MSPGDWSRLVKYVEQISAVLSVLINSLLIFLVVNKSPKHLGAYKYLMVFISTFEILYAYLDVILGPQHFSHGGTFLVIVPTCHRFLGPSVLRIMHLLYWWFFGASLAVFAVHFIYRYLVVSGNQLLATFSNWKMFIWSLIPIFYGLTWVLTGGFMFHPSPKTDEFIGKPVYNALGLRIGDYDYLGPYLYEKNGTSIILRTSDLLGLATIFASTTSSLCIVLFFGFKCYVGINRLMTFKSSSFNMLQSQLFYALVAQTIIPVLCMNLPAGIMFIFVFLDVNIGMYSSIVSMSIALYPAIDPIPNLFIIRTYRTWILNFLFPVCRRQKRTSLAV